MAEAVQRRPGRQQLGKKGGDSKPEPLKSHWKSSYDEWVADKHNADKITDGKSWRARNPPPPTGWARSEAHRIINASLATALELSNQFSVARQKATADLPQAARGALSEAIYGTGKKDFKAAAGKTMAGAGGWTAGCATNGGTSAVGDMLCVCGSTTGGGTDDCTGQNLDLGGDSNMIPHVTDILNLCPTKAASKLTSSRLRATIGTIAARIRQHAATTTIVHYLGKLSGTTCNGATTQQCVLYSKFYAKGTGNSGVLSIPWVAKLEEAAEKLDEAETEAATARNIAARLSSVIDTAVTAYNQTEPPQNAATIEHTATPNPTKDVKCTKQNSTAAECPSDHCNYDDKEKECKPKEGAETPAAGTEDGAAGTNAEAKKCSDKKTEGECKDGCKWEGET
uniref:Variant surface glycoprotein n=1 Tax=Trypanosoma brucei TaxID=5691 RepID=A0A1V0FZM3_9TRYP|nr:variant surface glycoprotein [Trypanosoma brucei]